MKSSPTITTLGKAVVNAFELKAFPTGQHADPPRELVERYPDLAQSSAGRDLANDRKQRSWGWQISGISVFIGPKAPRAFGLVARGFGRVPCRHPSAPSRIS